MVAGGPAFRALFALVGAAERDHTTFAIHRDVLKRGPLRSKPGAPRNCSLHTRGDETRHLTNETVLKPLFHSQKYVVHLIGDMSPPPIPTPIFRFLHVDNLRVCLQREALHSPNHTANDGLVYRTIHNTDIQHQRRVECIACGPAGVIHDYVAFYFGPRSPMLFQLHTGWVQGYTEGQSPLIYMVSSAQAVQQSGTRFVFSDGHGIARFTSWYDDLRDLDKVDWDAVYARIWKDTVDDMDRQRRKQAEFLVHQQCDWALIQEIGVVNDAMRARVEGILAEFDPAIRRPMRVHPEWYY